VAGTGSETRGAAYQQLGHTLDQKRPFLGSPCLDRAAGTFAQTSGQSTGPETVPEINGPNPQTPNVCGPPVSWLRVSTVGYARVAPLGREPARQHDALTAACADRVFTDDASGAARRPPPPTPVWDTLAV
jgi:hypothetical protein